MPTNGRAAHHKGIFVGAYVSPELAEWFRAKAGGGHVSKLVREVLLAYRAEAEKRPPPTPDEIILADADARSLKKKYLFEKNGDNKTVVNETET